jgi:hypothetical protein
MKKNFINNLIWKTRIAAFGHYVRPKAEPFEDKNSKGKGRRDVGFNN